jgi:serine/threonine-protein kinase
MAPEQTGTRVIDHRADLYAVGALLLELLTGEPPFGNDDLAVQLEQLLHKEPPLASSRITLPKAVRDDVDWLIARCLQKRPEDRPATARAVIVDIDRILHTLATAEKMETLARLSSAPPPHRDRRRIAYTVAGVAVMVAVALGAVLAAKWIGSTLPPAAGTVGRDTHEPSPVVAPPPPTAAPSALPPSATEVREAPEAHAVTVAKHLDAPAKQPASRGPRRTARRARDVGPRRVEIPLIAVPEKTESATDADTRTIRPTAPPAPQLLELRRADEAR